MAQTNSIAVTQDPPAPHAVDDLSSSDCIQNHIERILLQASRFRKKEKALEYKIKSFTTVVEPICSSEDMRLVMRFFTLGELRRDIDFLFLVTARVLDSTWERSDELAELMDRCIQAANGLHVESAKDQEDFWADLSEELSQLPVMSALSLVGVMEKYRKYIPPSERAAFNEAKAQLMARAQSVGFDQVKI